ncbi:MAG: DUF1003 domain-containing protein [Oscillospiraceae bacterium]
MTKGEKHRLAKIIIKDTDENIDDEQLIHQLLNESATCDIYQEEKSSFPQRAADTLAHFAGSWAFVLSFLGVLIVWIVANLYFLSRPFDPFPFILLNLVLSCIAALQAPLIMMSQNRQEHKDRKRAQSDYKIKFKKRNYRGGYAL